MLSRNTTDGSRPSVVFVAMTGSAAQVRMGDLNVTSIGSKRAYDDFPGRLWEKYQRGPGFLLCG